MTRLLQSSVQFGCVPASAGSAFSNSAGSLLVSKTILSRQRGDANFDELRKFWCELPIQERKDLLRIDKLTLSEQARKNLYCSRCHGLLLECYAQIVMYGRSLQQDFMGGFFPQKTNAEVLADNEIENLHDPSMHPWGGLATTKDGMLTLLDCFICANSPDVIHKVFSSARQREHDRELLYPDGCGAGGRGWISHGLANYGRAHGIRETCALHTSRLSCDTLLDFWSALGVETRSSLLNMKEDDFIERLMHRFDSKRFCRDCRRNVLREFKELKELKRLKKKLRCTSWFCVADTGIHYEVTEDSVLVDWQQSFTDISTYHHFEWAIGTAQGKSDIFDFQDVGMKGKVELKGLDLRSLSACFITLRGWKLDGRCTELSVMAYAVKGQACVHQRLMAGDGFVTITEGDSIRCFFEHAEEIEEEEDDESIDKDGIELDGDLSRPQKHAKSPELAREFLLDAATVIFKEQVEKAFREGTARQNSHSLFISLAINLLKDCVHVACKEIITLKKQIKLLEEEENEKRKEVERRERKKNKEREKKLRRKERLKEKERDREIKLIDAKQPCSNILISQSNPLKSINSDESLAITYNHAPGVDEINLESSFTEMTVNELGGRPCRHGYHEEEMNFIVNNDSFLLEQLKSTTRKLSFKRFAFQDKSRKWYEKPRSAFCNAVSIQESNMKLKASSRLFNGVPEPFRERAGRYDSRSCIDRKINEKFDFSHTRNNNLYNSLSGRNYYPNELIPMNQNHISTKRGCREVKKASIADSMGILPWQLSCNGESYTPDNFKAPKGRLVTSASGRDPIHKRQVWEPMHVRKKCIRSNVGINLTADTPAKSLPTKERISDKDKNASSWYYQKPSAEDNSPELSIKSEEINLLRHNENENKVDRSKDLDECFPSEKTMCSSKDIPDVGRSQSSSSLSTGYSYHLMTTSASSESCSSCPSEGDSGTSFSMTLNIETSLTSDSEDACSKSQNTLQNNKLGSRGDASSQYIASGPILRARVPSEVPKKVDLNYIFPEHQLPLPSFPSEFISYDNQNTKSLHDMPVISILSLSEQNYCMLPPPIGFNLHANTSSGFVMQHNTLQPITTAALNLEQAHLFNAVVNKQLNNSDIFRNEQTIETKESSLHEGTESRTAELNEKNKAFSLFYFGGPLIGAGAYPGHAFKSAESQDNVPCSMEDTKMEEYSLFAAKNSSRFLFSL